MDFRNRAFAFDSPAGAVAAMISRLGLATPPRTPPRCERCGLPFARGRVLAEPITADRDNPAFDYSAMDGYAVRLPERPAGVSGAESIVVPVIGEVRIGHPPPPLEPDKASAIRIVTGAAIPRYTDTVIKREDVIELSQADRPDGLPAEIQIPSNAVEAGKNIRWRAENTRKGDVVLEAGTILSAAALGTLAAVGCVLPVVRTRVRVAVMSTGDELISPDAVPEEFQIRDSNGAAVRSLLANHAWIEPLALSHVHDEGEQLSAALRESIATADAVVLTGGVSVGHRDPVRGAIEQQAGAEIVFHGLPQRPGKPMLGACVTRGDGARVPVFGLPGNPISAMVTCTRVVVPVLAACAGASRPPVPPRIPLANPDNKTLGLWWHRPVRLNERGEAELLDTRGSGDIVTGGRSDGFIEMPPHTSCTKRDTPALYPFYTWSS